MQSACTMAAMSVLDVVKGAPFIGDCWMVIEMRKE